jgi:6-phosphogluconolactonase
MKKFIQASVVATAQTFAEFLFEKQQNKESITIALSGGSTPKLLFDILANDFSASIDWKKIYLFWGDERCVSPTDDESNFKMTQDRLISKVNIPTGNIHRVLGENDPSNEAKRYSELIKSHVSIVDQLPQFDIVMLGLGEDGHTASIFPHQMELLHSDEVCAVATHPESGQKRISLTGKVINNAKEVCFLVTGAGKAEKVEEILFSAGNYKKYPAYYIQPKSGLLNWFIDEAAASKL